MAHDRSAEPSAPSSTNAWKVPAPQSRGARLALLLGGLLFLANLALIEYEVIHAGDNAPHGFTAGIFALILAPTFALATWIYASQQALRTFLLCLYPPVTANAIVWGGLVLGNHSNVDARLMVALITCAIWLVLLPALAVFANRVTSATRVHGKLFRREHHVDPASHAAR